MNDGPTTPLQKRDPQLCLPFQSREVTVGQTFQSRGQDEIPVALIRLCGRWLERAGFTAGDRVEVRVKAGELVLINRSL